jgi:chemotaxis protein methyltransferase CheR
MLLADERETLGGRRTEIVGTDISGERIAIARGGVYAQLEVQRGLPVQMLLRHFRKEGPNWRISQEMRGMVEFREWNLLSALRPLGEFDIVFCRNVLSCFDQQTRARVLKEIAARMAPDGFLYVGDAETVVGITSRLVPMANERAVYRVAGAVTMAA